MKVAILMGSTSDYDVMSAAVETLDAFGVPYEKRVISAHRTPDLMFEYARSAKANGIDVIIAGAGGAASIALFVLLCRMEHHDRKRRQRKAAA